VIQVLSLDNRNNYQCLYLLTGPGCRGQVSSAPPSSPTLEAHAKTRKSKPIGAVIINPGSTVLAPNLCVAIALGLDDDIDIAEHTAHRTQSVSGTYQSTLSTVDRALEVVDASETTAHLTAYGSVIRGVRSMPAGGNTQSSRPAPPERAAAFRRVRRFFSRNSPPRAVPQLNDGVATPTHTVPAVELAEQEQPSDDFRRVDAEPVSSGSDEPPPIYPSTPAVITGSDADSANVALSVVL
jgi:hypothetical protein